MHELWESQQCLTFRQEAAPSDICRNHGVSPLVLSIPMLPINTYAYDDCLPCAFIAVRTAIGCITEVGRFFFPMWIGLWDCCMAWWASEAHREERISGEKTSQGQVLRCVCGAAVPVWRSEIYPFGACMLHHR